MSLRILHTTTCGKSGDSGAETDVNVKKINIKSLKLMNLHLHVHVQSLLEDTESSIQQTLDRVYRLYVRLRALQRNVKCDASQLCITTSLHVRTWLRLPPQEPLLYVLPFRFG